jgi:hemolysin activation/secretion protein
MPGPGTACFLFNLNLPGSFFDDFGRRITSAGIVIHAGSVDRRDGSQKTADARRTRNRRRFRRAPTPWRACSGDGKPFLFGFRRGQVAFKNLDSSQKFILGGPTGVRAYPVGEAPGDEGHAFTLESRFDIPFMPSWAATQLVGFLDAGWVKLHRDLWPGAITSASGKNDYWLSGGGVGVNVGKAGLYSVRASYAHKIAPNEG